MNLWKTVLIFPGALILSMLACNLGVKTPTLLSPRDAAGTIVAKTLDVQGLPTSAGQVLNSPVPVTPTIGTPGATVTLTPTITPTYSVPMLTINANTNCRSGPGQDYNIIFTFLPSSKAEIVGRDAQDNYWVVKLPDGSGTCWIWGQYATTTGSYWVVPTLTAPSTATPAPPDAPTFQSWNYQCAWNGVNNNLNMILSWADHSNNETGFHVIRNDQVIADLPANSTSYTDVYAVNTGVSVTYRIEAYNASGSSSTKSISGACQ